MSEEDAELALIRRAAAGDAPALERLLVKHRGFLLNYADRHIPEFFRRSIDAADVVQDVYIQVFRRIGAFSAADGQAALRWFVTLARNRLVSLIRQQRAARRRGTGRDAVVVHGDGSLVLCLQDLAVYERTPSRSAASHELMQAMQRGLERLPPDHQQAIRLRYIEQLDLPQAAERMQRTDLAVRMLCQRGLKYLRTELKSVAPFI